MMISYWQNHKYRGTLYIASVLSDNDDIYPIGFMIANENEDNNRWTKSLCLLKQACPIISEQGFSQGVQSQETASRNGQRPSFLFPTGAKV